VFPILNIGGAAVQVPGLVLLIGFWLSLNLAGRRAKALGLSEDAVFNAGLLALVAGLVGARLGFVFLHWSAYQNDLRGILALTTGALSTPAGLLIGAGVAVLYLRRHRPPALILLDALAPALALMFAFISLADLSAGSAYGKVTDLPWAIDLWGARRHPTQIYELVAALATLALLSLARRASARGWARNRRPYGFLFLLFLLSYGGARLFLDAFRAAPWLLPGGYRAVQVIGLGAVVLALWFMSQQAVALAVSTTDSRSHRFGR
jgi:phosphatidylglycerol:prolipoprotein diacylglycerol transferase